MNWALGIGLVCEAALAEHATLTGRDRTAPAVPSGGATSKIQSDVAAADFIHLIYVPSEDPIKGTNSWAYAACNNLGLRLPNWHELDAMAKTGTLRDKVTNSCLWSATSAEGPNDRHFFFTPGSKERAWGESGFGGCAAVCLQPKDHFADIAALCPTGGMNWCEEGKTEITTCDGKNCKAEYRCICGDISIALSRCMRRKMGKKSWHMVTQCKSGGNVVSGHETIIAKFPASSPRFDKYCAMEPQWMKPGYAGQPNPAMCCWVQDAGSGDPKLPSFCGQKYCGQDETSASVWEGEKNYYPNDFSDNRKCVRDFMHKTGIEAEFLIK